MSSFSSSLDDWDALLRRFMGIDNTDRKHAEALFAELRASQPDATLTGLLGVVHSARGDDVRGLAAVLLRRVLLSDAVSLWPDASADVQRHVKQALLEILHSEAHRSIRRKVCDTVGELACSILEDGQWDELLPTLLTWSQDTTNVTLRETTLRVLEIITVYLAGAIESAEGDSDSELENTILSTLLRAMQDTQGRVGLNAVRALSMLLINMDAPLTSLQRPELLTNTVPLVLSTLHRLLNARQFDDVMELLEVLIEVAEPHGLYFKPMFAEIVDTMVQIADSSSDTIPDGCRQLAMEFLVSLAENAAPACRKLPKNGFVSRVFPVTFRMMLELSDLDTWSVATCEDEADELLVSQEISNFDVGSEALERLAGGIGAKKSLPKCFALIQEYASRQDSWLHRHAALVGLCQILEMLEPHELDEIVRHLLAQCHDPHPRVCCTAIDVIGQLAMDQAPHFQDAYHAQALGVLIHYLQQTDKPRLQAHAATALRQFIDMCSPALLAPYLENLLHQLFAVLQQPPQGSSHVVREQTLTALSSVATVAGPSFAQYYSGVMPTLHQILVGCLAESTTTGNAGAFTLGGITLECISLIGVAVGKDLFGQDAVEIMKLMAQMQQTPSIVENEGIRTYLLQAWARFCKCLGKDFASYLPVVMPTLLHAASQQAEFEVDPASLSEDDTASDTSSEHDDIQIAQVNDKCMSIRTSVLEEKATACQLLAGMVSDLEDAFFPYAEQVTSVLAPLMTETVHSDIRSASIAAMPALVQCVALATRSSEAVNAEAIKQMVDFAMGRLVHALTSEPELELVMNIMQSMKQCIDNAQHAHANAKLNEAQLREVVHALLLVLGDSFQRRAIKRAERALGSDDGEFEEEADEESSAGGNDEDDLEPEIQFLMADCIGHLAKTHGAAFFPVFQMHLWEKIVELSAAHCLAEDRKLALYILDDVIEHCGEPAVQQIDVFLPLLVDVLQTSEGYPPLIQAAAYGIGLLGRVGGARFVPHAQASLQLLLDVVALPHAQDPYMLNATDNAVSAIGLICVEHHAVVAANNEALFPQWLSMLPLRGDLEESVQVLTRLCGYVRESNAFVLQRPQHIAGLVRVFAQAVASARSFEKQVGKEAFAEAKSQITDALARLRASLPAEAMAQAWSGLSGPQQAALHALFT